MKNLIKKATLLFLLVAFATQSYSQKVNDNSMTYYGVDFTAAKLVGEIGFNNPDNIVENFFGKWNQIVASERKKYNFEKFMKKSDVGYNLEIVSERNKGVDPETLVINKSHKITKEDVQKVASAYKNADDSNKLGFVLVVESFDKFEENGTIWATFFNTATGEVISTKRIEGKPGGFGLRNFWAKSIFNVMKKSKKVFNFK